MANDIAARLFRWDMENNHNCGCFSSGTIRRGRQIVAYYAVCDSLPDAAIASIPGAVRIGVGSEYAPEIRRPAVMVYTKAEQARRKAAGLD